LRRRRERWQQARRAATAAASAAIVAGPQRRQQWSETRGRTCRRSRRRSTRIAAVRRRDDGQPVLGHQGGRSPQHVGASCARPRHVLQLGNVGPATGCGRPAARPVADGGRLVPAAEEVVPDAAAHVGQLWWRVRVVHAGRRRRVRASRPAGRAAPVRRQP